MGYGYIRDRFIGMVRFKGGWRARGRVNSVNIDVITCRYFIYRLDIYIIIACTK